MLLKVCYRVLHCPIYDYGLVNDDIMILYKCKYWMMSTCSDPFWIPARPKGEWSKFGIGSLARGNPNPSQGYGLNTIHT